MTCIVGAIMYCTANIVIPGPIGYAEPNGGQWTYVAYYQAPILTQRGLSIPAYANPAPRYIAVTERPGLYAAVARRY
jgi:hypothetical protein